MTAKKISSWLPAKWDLPDAKAIQQLAVGEATPEQQMRALRWIVEIACRTYEVSYDPESPRNTDIQGADFECSELPSHDIRDRDFLAEKL